MSGRWGSSSGCSLALRPASGRRRCKARWWTIGGAPSPTPRCMSARRPRASWPTRQAASSRTSSGATIRASSPPWVMRRSWCPSPLRATPRRIACASSCERWLMRSVKSSSAPAPKTPPMPSCAAPSPTRRNTATWCVATRPMSTSRGPSRPASCPASAP